MTSCASAWTAPSTHPPETLPTTSPSAATAIEAPAGRGEEFHVRTTVATAQPRPCSAHARTAGSTSRTRGPPVRAQLPQAVEHGPGVLVVPPGGDEAVG